MSEPLLQIDKNIPLSPPGGGINAKRSSKYPFDKMEVGDSIFVEKAQNAASATVGPYQKHNAGKKFTTRKVDGGTRIWRVE